MNNSLTSVQPRESTTEHASVCPICGEALFDPLFQVPFPGYSSFPGKAFPLDKQLDVPAWRIVACRDCTVRYPNPMPTREAIVQFYANQAEPNDWEVRHYVEIPEAARKGWDRFAEKLTRLNGKPGAILEIGCAAGWLLHGARGRGWDVCGIEASPKFQKYASSVLKLPVHLGTLEDFQSDKKFDVVVMTDVIEHLHDPVADLRLIRKLMNPGGFLVLATCDIGSTCARFWGLAWRQIVISHTFYWTKRSMARALERAGFNAEQFSEPRYWDPDKSNERRDRRREIAKLLARFALIKTYVPITTRFTALHSWVSKLSGGKLDHEKMLFKIGDQPVLGDVMLVVARPV